MHITEEATVLTLPMSPAASMLPDLASRYMSKKNPCLTATERTDTNRGTTYVGVCLHPRYPSSENPADPADLDEKGYYCDYLKCDRRNEPFYRMDQFRNHLRGYHNEDAEVRRPGSEFSQGCRQEWRRCSVCLKRIPQTTRDESGPLKTLWESFPWKNGR